MSQDDEQCTRSVTITYSCEDPRTRSGTIVRNCFTEDAATSQRKPHVKVLVIGRTETLRCWTQLLLVRSFSSMVQLLMRHTHTKLQKRCTELLNVSSLALTLKTLSPGEHQKFTCHFLGKNAEESPKCVYLSLYIYIYGCGSFAAANVAIFGVFSPVF